MCPDASGPHRFSKIRNAPMLRLRGVLAPYCRTATILDHARIDSTTGFAIVHAYIGFPACALQHLNRNRTSPSADVDGHGREGARGPPRFLKAARTREPADDPVPPARGREIGRRARARTDAASAHGLSTARRACAATAWSRRGATAKRSITASPATRRAPSLRPCIRCFVRGPRSIEIAKNDRD